MARATSDPANRDKRVALSNGDTVIARANIRARNGHTSIALKVNAIGVGAVGRGIDGDRTALKIVAIHHNYMEELAIDRRYILDDSVVCVHKADWLQAQKLPWLSYETHLAWK